MGNIGLPELLIVLVIALVVFGPQRLPEMGRQLGQTIREFRAATTEIRSQIGVDDIAGSVNDIKSSLSLTGDARSAEQPTAASAGPAAVAPVAVAAAVASPAVAAADTPAAVEPATLADEATTAEAAAAEAATEAAPATPSAPTGPGVPTAPSAGAQAGADDAAGDPAGVETFGKLGRSTAPTPPSTPAD
jgi:sec-independent protein translocase protein TatA